MSAAEFEVMGRIAQSIADMAERKLRHVELTEAELCDVLNALYDSNRALWRKLTAAESFSYTEKTEAV